MNLTGSTVRFRLLAQSRGVFEGVAPDAEFLEGFVVNEDHLGVWLALPEFSSPKDVVLLKWEHFSTAMTEYRPEMPPEHRPAGFRR